MAGPRQRDDDLVTWTVDLFRTLLADYAKHGAPSAAVSAEQIEAHLATLDVEFRDTWGGQLVYICRAPWRDSTERDAQIKVDRATMSLSQLAIKYSLARNKIRRICGELD